MRLLNPGPVTLTERVRRSLLQPDLCHRESEFFDLQEEVRRRLLAVYGLDPGEWTAVLLSASGTGAVESMVASLVPEDGAVLNAENGVYGERIAQICAQYRIPCQRSAADWMQPLDVAALAGLVGPGRCTHLAVVHHETTTGRLNDLGRLSELCRAHGLGLLLDGVSSFGAEALDFGDASLTAVAATANKCLRGVREGAQPNLLPGPRASRATPGSAQHAVHARGPCLLRAARGAAGIRGRGRPGGAPPALRRSGGASASRVGRIGHRYGGTRGAIFRRAACVPPPGGLDVRDSAR